MKTPNEHGVKVGDIFYSSWGYEQTNVDFYEVVAVTPKTATVKPLECEKNENGFMQGTLTPKPGEYITGSSFYKESYRTKTMPSYSGNTPMLRNVDGREHLGYLYQNNPISYTSYY